MLVQEMSDSITSTNVYAQRSSVQHLILLDHSNAQIKSRKLDLSNPVKLARQTTIAPSESNAVFSSRVLSRNHALFQLIDGLPHVSDAGSSNGTFLNGVRLSPENIASEPVPLRDGDQLVFGVDILESDGTVKHPKVILKVALNATGTSNVLDLVNEEIKKTSTVSAELVQLKHELTTMETVLKTSFIPSALNQQKLVDDAKAETKLWKEKYNALAPLLAAQDEKTATISQLELENARLNDLVAQLEQASQNKNELETLTTELELASSQKQDLELQVENLKKEIDFINGTLGEKVSRLEAAVEDSKTSNLSQPEIQHLEQLLLLVSEEKQELSCQFHDVSRQLEKEMTEKTLAFIELARLRDSAESEAQELSLQLESLKNEMALIKGRNQEFTEREAKLITENSQTTTELAELSSQIKEMQTEMQLVQSQNKQIQEDFAQEKESLLNEIKLMTEQRDIGSSMHQSQVDSLSFQLNERTVEMESVKLILIELETANSELRKTIQESEMDRGSVIDAGQLEILQQEIELARNSMESKDSFIKVLETRLEELSKSSKENELVIQELRNLSVDARDTFKYKTAFFALSGLTGAVVLNHCYNLIFGR